MKTIQNVVGLLLSILILTACGGDSDDDTDPNTCVQGTLDCQCIDGRTCDEGLTCESGLCVEEDEDPFVCGPGTRGGPNSCEIITCGADERVADNACEACPPGTTNEAGDDASGNDTACEPVTCGEDEQVVDKSCQPCPVGTSNEPGDDASGDDTSCDIVTCAADERVVDNSCQACPVGTSNEPGDDASGEDTSCEPILCGDDERVVDNACVACPAGSTNMAGDDATGPDTTCDAQMCPSNERVVANRCVPCPAGTTNDPGDDPSGPDTTCDVVTCGADERVASNACVACAPGTTNDAGDDASGPDTTCDAVTCGVDEYVENNQCVACGAGSTNDAGDDASGPDTVCDDACSVVLGLTCDDVAEAYVKPSTVQTADNFGWSVAVSGDIMVVGTRGEDSCADGVDPANGESNNACPNAGAAYVFERDATSGAWSQTAYLKSTNSGINDLFGSTVAATADWVAVGAPFESSCSTGINSGGGADDMCGAAGAVFVYRRSATSGAWSVDAYIKPSNTDTGDAFGQSISASGDRLLVGSPGEASCATGINPSGGAADNGCPQAGAAYLFEYDSATSTWSETTYIKASNTELSDEFGGAVSIDGDRIAVGAVSESSCATGVNPAGGETNNSCIYAGAAYVYDFDSPSSTWSQVAYLKASNAESQDDFGHSVAVSGDFVAVSSLGEDSCADGVDPANGESDNACSTAGAVYVFERDMTGTWSQAAYVKASNSEVSDNFGHRLDLAGDRLAVAAAREGSCIGGLETMGAQADNACNGAGAVYLFERDATGTWAQILYIKSDDPDTFDRFGASVAISSTFLVVGANDEDSCGEGINPAVGPSDDGCSGAGATYLYRLAP